MKEQRRLCFKRGISQHHRIGESVFIYFQNIETMVHVEVGEVAIFDNEFIIPVHGSSGWFE